MAASDDIRDTLRREAFELKLAFADLAQRLQCVDPEAAASAHRGRMMAFETWSHLATPFEETDPH